MPLVDVELEAAQGAVPEPVREFLQEVEMRIDRFVHDRDRVLPGFVPSDFVSVYRTLRTIADAGLAPERSLCEWGSGFGVVACLAAMLGFYAYGIEIEEELVDEAERLACDFEVEVEFACGNFIPREAEHLADRAHDSAWLAVGGGDAHAEIDLDPADFGVVFAYPWPGDETVIYDVFEHAAATGSMLVTYHGIDGVRVQRKTNR